MTAPLTVRATPNNPLGAVLGAADRPRQPSPSQPPLCRPAPICCATPSAHRWTGRPRPGRTTEGAKASPPLPAVSGPRGSLRTASAARRPVEKSISVGAARLPQIGGLSVGYYQSQTPRLRLPSGVSQPKVQLLTVDHSARGSMKTAANCVS